MGNALRHHLKQKWDSLSVKGPIRFINFKFTDLFEIADRTGRGWILGVFEILFYLRKVTSTHAGSGQDVRMRFESSERACSGAPMHRK